MSFAFSCMLLAAVSAPFAHIENGRLSVDFNTRDGSFEVTDGESGRVWRSGAEFARDRFVVEKANVDGKTA